MKAIAQRREAATLEGLVDKVLCHDVRDAAGKVAVEKGARLTAATAKVLLETSWEEIHLLVVEPLDLHEEEAGKRLAAAVVGDGGEVKGYTGGQWTLVATRRRLGARRGRRVDGAQAGRRGGADRGRGERARPSRSRLRWAHAAGRPHGAPRCSGSSRELALARDLGRQGRARDADLRHVFPGDDVRPGVASHSRRRARGQPDAGGAGPRRTPLARRGVPLPALPHGLRAGHAELGHATPSAAGGLYSDVIRERWRRPRHRG